MKTTDPRLKQIDLEAVKYIEAQLEDGYIDLGLHDEKELKVIREAMELYKNQYIFVADERTMFIKSRGKDEKQNGGD